MSTNSRTTFWSRIKRKLTNLFFPEVMVGGTGNVAMNRKQRRTQASINRKSKRSK